MFGDSPNALGCREDHDAHHRHGRAGLNYGKQSRVWDRIFGTAAEREETFR